MKQIFNYLFYCLLFSICLSCHDDQESKIREYVRIKKRKEAEEVARASAHLAPYMQMVTWKKTNIKAALKISNEVKFTITLKNNYSQSFSYFAARLIVRDFKGNILANLKIQSYRELKSRLESIFEFKFKLTSFQNKLTVIYKTQASALSLEFLPTNITLINGREL